MIYALLGLMLAQSAGFELPATPCAGWNATPQKIIKPAGILDYMDGAGELYLGYGFNALYTRDYQKPGEPKITCELCRMPSSADAYGLFSQDRTGKPMKIGQGAVYGSGLLLAWQGKCFVRVMADRETPAAKQCVTEIAKQVVKLCGPNGKPPAALAWLPKKGLDPLSVHYFHTNSCLNYFHYVSSRNILDLSLKTKAVMGRYSSPAGKSLVLVIGYPTPAAARKAWGEFRESKLNGLHPTGEYSLVKLENGKWLAGKQSGSRLSIVLESPTREECLRAMRLTTGGK